MKTDIYGNPPIVSADLRLTECGVSEGRIVTSFSDNMISPKDIFCCSAMVSNNFLKGSHWNKIGFNNDKIIGELSSSHNLTRWKWPSLHMTSGQKFTSEFFLICIAWSVYVNFDESCFQMLKNVLPSPAYVFVTQHYIAQRKIWIFHPGSRPDISHHPHPYRKCLAWTAPSGGKI